MKNFPSEEDVRNALAGIADSVEFIERPNQESWNVIYNVKKESSISLGWTFSSAPSVPNTVCDSSTMALMLT